MKYQVKLISMVNQSVSITSSLWDILLYNDYTSNNIKLTRALILSWKHKFKEFMCKTYCNMNNSWNKHFNEFVNFIFTFIYNINDMFHDI
jgi:hypothetical protein